ncbi:MAG: hypothetical protein HWN79_00310 [Candidatus Lokiarchaeota archaeon]|nr:hypothetical protein [Candidatus Lokiarchaeota archaeon]
MKIRKYLWILNLVGAIIIIISIITPTSYNDTTSTFYYVWMNQIGVDIDPLDIYLLRTDLELVTISTILALIIFSSALMTITLTSMYIRNSIPFKKLQWKTIIFAVLVIISTLYWIIMMESFYNEAGYNHWVTTGGGYTPFFGVIGPFIGAALIVIGSFVRRK